MKTGMKEVAELPYEEAVAALSTTEQFAPELAEEYARDGHVYSFGGSPLVAYLQEHLITQTTDINVPFVSQELLTHAGSTWSLIEVMLKQWEGVDQLVLRTGPGLPLQRAGLCELRARYIALTASPKELSTELEIRPVGPESVAFVHELLTDAIMRGYSGSGFPVDVEYVREHVRDLYEFSAPDAEVESLVGWLGPQPIGHITWFPDAEDLVSGEKYFQIVDVYVIDGYRDRGYSGVFTAALENKAAPADGLLVGSVAREPDASDDRLYARFCGSGWSPKFDVWVSKPDSL